MWSPTSGESCRGRCRRRALPWWQPRREARHRISGRLRHPCSAAAGAAAPGLAGGQAHTAGRYPPQGALGILASMSRLQTTDGLTDEQTELVKLVREFVDEQIIPVAQELEHADEYPEKI